MKILIAEDNAFSAITLRRALEKLGYEVELARNGAEAWKRLTEDGVELLISDWMMPEMDGLELCRKIRTRPDAFYTYVILLTALDSREDRLAGLEAGADDFLTKPFDSAELIARLNVARRILSMQEQLRTHTTQLVELHAQLARQNELLGRQNAMLLERAATDGLTGLGNRRHFDEALAAALSYARRYGQPVSLALIDADHFKSLNDTFGHLAGDEVLKAIAETLRDGARSHDVVARYGGEEFVVLLPNTPAEGARLLAERLRSAIASDRRPPRPITASFGVATMTSATCDAPELIADADRALYHAKATGRNRVVHRDELPDTKTGDDGSHRSRGPVEPAASR